MIDAAEFDDRVGVAAPSYADAPFYAELRGAEAADELACERCPCRQEARRVTPGEGPPDAEFVVLGQNPGEEEDQHGRPFIGRGGQELDTWLLALGLDRQKILVTNTVKCHTTRNRVPRQSEINICSQAWLRQEFATFDRLKVVIPLGLPAAKVILGKMKVPSMEPFWVKVQFGVGRVLHCIPLPHPAYLLRMPGKRPELFTRVLPFVAEYLTKEVGDAYARARP